MTNLFNLISEYEMLLTRLDIDEDYTVDNLNNDLDSMTATIGTKINNVALMSKELASKAEIIRNHAKQMLVRADLLDDRSRWLKEYLKLNMLRCNITKFDGVDCKVAIRNNPPRVNIINDKLIPPIYWKQPEPLPPQIDKTMISADLKLGVKIDGVSLTQAQSVVISG